MKQKLLLVSDTFHPQVDGTVIFLDEFLRRAKDSFDISVLVPRFTEKSSHTPPSVSYLDISSILKPLPAYPSIKISFKNLRKIQQAVHDADIVFIQGPALASFLAMYYGHRYGKRTVAYTHVLSWELFEKSASPLLGIFTPLLKKMCLFFYNYCDEVLVPYQELKERLQREGMHCPITVARLGVDITRFSPSTDKRLRKRALGISNSAFVVGYVGRISPEKNVQVLRKAFLRLVNAGENVHLLLVGDGAPEQREEFNSLPRCTVTGFVHNVQDYLKAMDVFVMPSLTETTSLATLEAMSCGVPVIVTKVGFMKKYVTRDYNGLFFPKGDASTLATKIEKLRQDKTLRERFGSNARKTVAYSFSWERSINKIRRLLQKGL